MKAAALLLISAVPAAAAAQAPDTRVLMSRTRASVASRSSRAFRVARANPIHALRYE